MSIGMIILAGGVGSRMGTSSPKQFALLGGKPVLMHILDKVVHLDEIDELVITCPAEYIEQTESLVENHHLNKEFTCIVGGDTRQASVYKGLMALGEHDAVIIHEAVRPFVTIAEFEALLDSEHDNVIYGTEIPFTVLQGNDRVEGTLARSELVNVQLPQKFDVALLTRAHELAIEKGIVATEDASLVFDLTGEPIAILPGSEMNIKITHPVDLIIGEAIYDQYVLGKDRRP